MKKQNLRSALDLLPLIILAFLGIQLVYQRLTDGLVLNSSNWLGFLLLAINIYLFLRLQQLGVVALGVLLLLGLFGVVRFSAGIETTTISIGSEHSLAVFSGQPIYFLLLILHFSFSYRFYFGIASSAYWKTLFDKIRVRKLF